MQARGVDDLAAKQVNVLRNAVLAVVRAQPDINGTEVENRLRAQGVVFRNGDGRKVLGEFVAEGAMTMTKGSHNRSHYRLAGVALPEIPDVPQSSHGTPGPVVPSVPTPRGGTTGITERTVWDDDSGDVLAGLADDQCSRAGCIRKPRGSGLCWNHLDEPGRILSEEFVLFWPSPINDMGQGFTGPDGNA